MKKTISTNDFIQEFKNYGRGEQFSREGLITLFDYLEELEESTGIEIELDIIAICCDYTEYKSLEDFKNDYDYEDIETIEDIENYTTVIKINDTSFIIQNF